MKSRQDCFNDYYRAAQALYAAEKIAGKECIDVRLLNDYSNKKEKWEAAAKGYLPQMEAGNN